MKNAAPEGIAVISLGEQLLLWCLTPCVALANVHTHYVGNHPSVKLTTGLAAANHAPGSTAGRQTIDLALHNIAAH